ncbi:Regulatory-associated protein of mTOR [Eumeta japonica]|uniref:Regulatory-associated protein of mTOR n=1 Tax=Eumeta variegata TaxID=151549 RepID=A0A4C1UYA9_EUMVA|nr:Regulatory-associated protein of mTOR [Eumeta japonica]
MEERNITVIQITSPARNRKYFALAMNSSILMRLTKAVVKKLCCSLRRNAKDERVLFHYNGHGVPKPTSQGEIWVFNRAYTQYIPLSMYDLQTWMGAPSLYVYDCSNAGVIIEKFKHFAEQHEREFEANTKPEESGVSTLPPVSYRNCLQLGACAAGQSLPMNPELPADLFTACLTTPITMAMKWFVLRNRTRVTPVDVADLIDKIPGQVSDRRTMLGELNWIFTAITDTIAWNSLSPELFQQLFRADLLTASLCRNFLLADRIMRSYNCTPVSSPALPSLAGHPLWQAWDQTLDLALAQLPAMLSEEAVPYEHSPFFREQLTAFQVWLDLGSPQRPPPDQLPMVLQVLLSTLHRVRALQILCRFLALGAWAVRAVLAVGIFPYMLKLLQASAHELRASMVYIWAKIMAVDPSCQADLVNAKGHKYFLAVLQDPTVDSEHRTLAAYVLAGIVDNYPLGQEAALQGSMLSVCLEQLHAPDGAPALRQWLALCLGRLWRDYDAARWSGVRDLAHEKLYPLLQDPHPEVRAACVFALGTYVRPARERSEHANTIDQQVAVELAARVPLDASPIVRAEILAALQWIVLTFEQHFIAVLLQDDLTKSRGRPPLGRVDPGIEALMTGGVCGGSGAVGGGLRIGGVLAKVPSHSSIPSVTLPTIGFGSVYMKLWETLCGLARDPHPQVSALAADIVGHVRAQLDVVGETEARTAHSSTSLPPSPNTRGMIHVVHPQDQSRTLPHSHSRKGKSGFPNTITEDISMRDSTSSTMRKSSVTYPLRQPIPLSIRYPIPTQTTGDALMTPLGLRMSMDDGDHLIFSGSHVALSPQNCHKKSQTSKRPIVSTQFVQWAEAQFGAGGGEDDWRCDEQSRLYQQRRWRYSRNRELRREARALRQARITRLETQAFNSRCVLPPTVILFHPFDQHIVVASKENFGIWDWGTGAKLCVGTWRRTAGRITALEYVNAHERALLAVASNTGALAIYRPAGSGQEPQLVTAWRALDVRASVDYCPPPGQPIYSIAQLVSEQFMGAPEERNTIGSRSRRDKSPHGSATSINVASIGTNASSGSNSNAGYSPPLPSTLLSWCGMRRTLALAGPAPVVRIWDANTELKSHDIDTGCEAAATSLWRGGSCPVEAGGPEPELVVGFGDGSVCAWDERVPTAPLYRLHDHHTAVLCTRTRPDLYTMVTGCVSGEIRIYDTRKRAVMEVTQAAGPLAAVDVHPLCNLFACGSTNQCISIYDLKGTLLNTVKFHEGFMGARIGPVSCLTFHPLRCALAVGAKDSTVSVYVSATRRGEASALRHPRPADARLTLLSIVIDVKMEQLFKHKPH